MSDDLDFSRRMLRLIHADVRKRFPHVQNVKNAWVMKHDRNHWEFHFAGFYWHGRADNAYDARVKGWDSWIAAWERLEGEEAQQ